MEPPDLNAFGDEAAFDHVGVAVPSIREAVEGDLRVVSDGRQKVSVAFVELNGLRVELIEPHDEDSPVASSLESGRQLVHICYRVPDLDAAIRRGREHGFHRIGSPTPAVAFSGRRIAWVFSRTYGLVELLEA
jgi:methylmalonyl-CoA/ethylmalonyl-CoA epimerase